jgi:hypothetical protein
VLSCPGGTGATKHLSPTFLRSKLVYSQTLCVFALEHGFHIASLHSRVHETWSVFNSATLEERLRYNSSSCFETFPFPIALLVSVTNDPTHESTRQSLEAIGERYHQFRAELMVSNNEGLTSTYNRFHDPSETSSGLLQLRALHQEMDQAVLQAYGWSDALTQAISDNPHHTPCGFGLDYLDIEDDIQLPDDLQERIASGELFFWEAGDALDFQGQLQACGAISGRRKLPWRYRWPDAVRDDVLARLLALNAERYEEEVDQGLHGGGRGRGGGSSSGGSGTGRRRGRPPKTPPTRSDQIALSL